MPLTSNPFQITMELYETDKNILQNFIETQETDGIFSEKYLILFNFAEDLKYSKHIQPGLARHLLPFYLKTASQAVLYGNKTAEDIYCEFNLALFLNKENFIQAVGEKNYRYLMEYYTSHTVKKMEMENRGMAVWVSLFNTTAAIFNNIQILFKRISQGSLKVKYSFFKYISVFLFKESDNLLAEYETKPFWTSSIWDFDSGCTSLFFWNKDTISIFDRKVNREWTEALFNDVKTLICYILGLELTGLFIQEMDKSFNNGTFNSRKEEYLKKISSKSEYKYWDETF